MKIYYMDGGSRMKETEESCIIFSRKIIQKSHVTETEWPYSDHERKELQTSSTQSQVHIELDATFNVALKSEPSLSKDTC